MENNDSIKILHLSDLHFGWDENQSQKDNRQIALYNLIEKLENLDVSWKPNCVCITGDIGWRGSVKDYEEATKWINKLLERLTIKNENLFLCPGNHDVNRALALDNIRPANSNDADRVLKVPIPEHYLKPFEAYSNFCDSIGIPRLKLGESENNLIGVRKLGNISFITINTAWFSQGNDDKGNLWIGLPLIKHLFARNQIRSIEQSNGEITIALFHHPKEWLNDAEQRAEDYGRENTFDYLASRCHLILTGHTHGEVRKADRFTEGAYHLSGGATYAGGSYYNSFRIIKVENDKFIYRSFEYDPRSPSNNWQSKGEITGLPFFLQIDDGNVQKTKLSDSLNTFREKSLYNAEKIIQDKSRAIKPIGVLPKTLPLEVLQTNKGQHHSFSSDHRLILDSKNQVKLPLSIAIKQSRRTLILGDLGTGKSTLVALYTKQSLQENPKSFALIVPARSIKDYQTFTARKFLELISKYYNEQINPAGQPINIENLLNERIETTLVIDGLDEVSSSRAVELLESLADVADNWSNVQVVATGRPVELQGVNFENWNVVLVAPLNENDKHSFVKEELVSQGHNESEASQISQDLIRKLKKYPDLNNLTNTPLIIRLIVPKLQKNDTEEFLSLGDFLYELINERLEKWNVKDRKKSVTSVFEKEFPDAFSRTLLFGQLALKLNNRKTIQIDEVKFQLQELVRKYSSNNHLSLANESYQFLINTGLVVVSTDQMEFGFQSLFEFLSSFGLIAKLQQGSITHQELIDSPWRIVSFFSTILRKTGSLQKNISILKDYINQIFKTSLEVPIIAYIVSESQNEELAKEFVRIISQLESNPIVFLENESAQSARAIAKTLKLSGQVGFDWYYSKYLDPRYPSIHRGSFGIDEVFNYWALFSINELSEHEKSQLQKLVAPHIQTGSSKLISTIRVLAVLIPDAFTDEEKLWFYASLLLKTDFSPIVEKLLREAHANGNSEIVNKVLIEHAKVGYENTAEMVHLWLKLNNEIPPIPLIKSLVRYRGYNNNYWDFDTVISEVIIRISLKTWKSFLRFYLFAPDTSLASGAAIELYNLGERKLNLLIPALLEDIHDGKSYFLIEQILNQLVPKENTAFLNNLANKIKNRGNDYSEHGAHSGWWRLFLTRLPFVENGGKLLADCVEGVGSFILPRYPEIRQSFRDLLSGTEGEKYEQALSKKLLSLNPRIRHGAAMILVVCSPHQDTKAFDIILNNDYRFGMWHEWFIFLLTITVQPSVLLHIKSNLPKLNDDARKFALALLYKNEIPLEPNEIRTLVEGLTENKSFGLDTNNKIVSSSVAFDSLLQIVSESGIKKSSNAAYYLLNFHAEKLSITQKAKCAILYAEKNAFGSDFLDEQIAIIKKDKNYRQEIRKVSVEVKDTIGKTPLLELICESLFDNSSWDEIVWRLVCDDSSIRGEIEDEGMWLLNFGKANPEVGQLIGESANKFLGSQISKYNKRFAKSWLVILADEFMGLPSETINKTLPTGDHMFSIETALFARLENNWDEFKQIKSVGSVPDLTKSFETEVESKANLIDKLKVQTFDSSNVNPQLCETIEQLIPYGSLSNKQKATISSTGRFGLLATVVLAFIHEESIALHKYPEILTITRGQNEHCANHLLNLCVYSLFSILEVNSSAKKRYLKILRELLVGQDEAIDLIANQILDIKGAFEDAEVKIVFNYLVSNQPRDREDFQNNLISWIVNLDKANKPKNIIEEIKSSLIVLEGVSLRFSFNSPFCFLFFSLAYWALGGKADETSINIFVRGMKFVFLRTGNHNQVGEDLSKMMIKFQPLLNKTPSEHITKAILYGREVEDPEIRAICSLLCLGN
jgi:predicted MPP superfamily phosphohydrolase